MRFGWPHALWGLFALPLVFLWMLLIQRMRRKRLQAFAESSFWPHIAGEFSPARRNARTVVMLAALALLIVALARPQWGVKERPLVREGSDLMICLDVSTSMLARDIQPNRLERAKEQVRALIRNLQGDRVGLVVFAGESFVQCPPTLDYALASHLVEIVTPTSVSVQGTRIGDALQTTLNAFDRSAMGSRSIILVTDGEDHEGKALEVAKAAAAQGVVIQCVGIGTQDGVPIQLPNGNYKEDKQGRKILSKLGVETLRKIAETTSGRLVITDPSGNMNLDRLYADIRSLQKNKFDAQQTAVFEERFQWPLALALLLFTLDFWLGDRRRAIGWRSAAALPNTSWVQRLRTNLFSLFSVAAFSSAALALAPAGARAAWTDFGNTAARLTEEGNRDLEEANVESEAPAADPAAPAVAPDPAANPATQAGPALNAPEDPAAKAAADARARKQKEAAQRALDKYESALVESKGRAELELNAGLALSRLGKTEEALKRFESAIQRSNSDPRIKALAKHNAATLHLDNASKSAAAGELDDAIDSVIKGIDETAQAAAASEAAEKLRAQKNAPSTPYDSIVPPDAKAVGKKLDDARGFLNQLVQQKRQQQQQSGQSGKDDKNKKNNKQNKNDQQNQDSKGGESGKQQQEKDNDKKQQEQEDRQDSQQKNPKDGKQQEGKDEEKKSDSQAGSPGSTPTPTMTPPPQNAGADKEKKQEKDKKDQQGTPAEGQAGGSGEGEKAEDAQQMTEADVSRLLSTLPDEDLSAIRKLMGSSNPNAQRGKAASDKEDQDW